MLTTCKECGETVSDKAHSCPHCGCPLTVTPKSQPIKKKTARRMRLPNGFGQISFIKNQDLRNPYRVMIPDGKTETGRPKAKLLKPKAYFKTYNEAYTALTKYWESPHLPKDITMLELHKLWVEEEYKDAEPRLLYRKTDWPWKHCESVYRLKVSELKSYHVKKCMEDTEEFTLPSSLRTQIRIMFNQMLDYAVENDFAEKNVARQIKSMRNNYLKEHPYNHTAYTDDELKVLWSYSLSNVYVDMTLVQCYSGFRPSEVCGLKTQNIDVDEWIMVGGMKTKAGTNRTVPIHTCIRPIIKYYYDIAKSKNQVTLFVSPARDTEIIYDNFYKNLKIQFGRIGVPDDHMPHDGRKTFITLAKNNSVNEFAIKKIVGHSVSDLTERVYTERPISWLSEEIEKIRV